MFFHVAVRVALRCVRPRICRPHGGPRKLPPGWPAIHWRTAASDSKTSMVTRSATARRPHPRCVGITLPSCRAHHPRRLCPGDGTPKSHWVAVKLQPAEARPVRRSHRTVAACGLAHHGRRGRTTTLRAVFVRQRTRACSIMSSISLRLRALRMVLEHPHPVSREPGGASRRGPGEHQASVEDSLTPCA